MLSTIFGRRDHGARRAWVVVGGGLLAGCASIFDLSAYPGGVSSQDDGGQPADADDATRDATLLDGRVPDVDSAPPFRDPSAAAGNDLVAWLDADDPSRLSVADGDAVASWPSRGTGFAFSPCNLPSPPPKLRRHVGKFKAMSAFDFGGTAVGTPGPCLETASAFVKEIADSEDLAVFTVAYWSTVPSTDYLVFAILDSPSFVLSAFGARNDVQGFTVLHGKQIATSVGGDSSAHLFTAHRRARTLEVRVDRQLVASQDISASPSLTIPAGATLTVGGSAVGVGSLPGEVATVVVVRSPPAAMVGEIEAYLHARYGQ